MFNQDFYPTPMELAIDMCKLVDFNRVTTVLEPSAGKGDLLNALFEFLGNSNASYRLREDKNVFVVEKEPALRAILKDLGYMIAGCDFLDFKPLCYFDLIFANPPFSEGDKHLLKMIGLGKKNPSGCQIVCLLNAETIKNPYTNLRKSLMKQLNELSAKVKFIKNAFSSAERKSDVEIALIYIDIPEKDFDGGRIDLDSLLSKEQGILFDTYFGSGSEGVNHELAFSDKVLSAVALYQAEAKAGLEFIKTYLGVAKVFHPVVDRDRTSYADDLITLNIGKSKYGFNKTSYTQMSLPRVYTEMATKYLRSLRLKYWQDLLVNSDIMRGLTSEHREKYMNEFYKLCNYEFNVENIRALQVEWLEEFYVEIMKAIENMFDYFTVKFAQYDGSPNMHYYNGWKTNQIAKINGKVIVPAYGVYDNIFKSWRFYEAGKFLDDLVLCLNYVQGKTDKTASRRIEMILQAAADSGQSTNIVIDNLISVNFYKKGTMHIKFLNEDVLMRLNLLGARSKNALPPNFTSEKYSNLGPDEKRFVDEFMGQAQYNKFNKDTQFQKQMQSGKLLLE